MLWIFIILCLIGIADASYLIYKHYKKKPLTCPVNDDCTVVTESKWSSIFGIRTEVLGLLYYVGMLAAVIVLTNYLSEFVFLIQIGTGLGLLFSLFLTYIQFFKLKHFCFYCLSSGIVSLLLFVASWFL
jgi:uncharacterized membrane protein